MRFPTYAAAALFGASLIALPAPASAAPLGGLAKDLSQQSRTHDGSLVEYVQRRRGYRGGPRRGYHRRNNSGVAAGAILGLGLGAIVGSQAARGHHSVEYCMQRYRSYDPRTGTWVDYQGRVRACP